MYIRIPLLAVLIFFLCCAASAQAATDYSDADLDGDGRLTPADLKLLAQDINTHAAAFRGDLNNDNRVDESDVRSMAILMIKRVISGSSDIPDQVISSFINSVMNDPRIGDPGAGGSPSGAGNSPWIKTPPKEQDPPNLRRWSDKTYQQLLSRLVSGQDMLTVEQLQAEGDQALPAESADESSLKDIYGRIKRSGFVNPAEEVMGQDPEYPAEIDSFFKKLSPLTLPRKLNRNSVQLDFDSLHQARKVGNLSLGGMKIEDFLQQTTGMPAESIPSSEPGDSMIYNSLDSTTRDTLQARCMALEQRNQNKFSSSENAFLPRPPLDLLLDNNNPKEISFFDSRRRSSENLKEEYKRVGPRKDGDPLPPTESNSSIENSDDPFVTQVINSMTDNHTFKEMANLDQDATTTRGEFLRMLFHPSSAVLAASGGMQKIGINPGSDIARNYIQIFNQQRDNLVSQGVITNQQAQDITQAYDSTQRIIAQQAAASSSGSPGASSAASSANSSGASSGDTSGGNADPVAESAPPPSEPIQEPNPTPPPPEKKKKKDSGFDIMDLLIPPLPF